MRFPSPGPSPEFPRMAIQVPRQRLYFAFACRRIAMAGDPRKPDFAAHTAIHIFKSAGRVALTPSKPTPSLQIRTIMRIHLDGHIEVLERPVLIAHRYLLF